EAALVGEQYDGWNLGRYPNKPYHIVDTAGAPWLFAGTHLHDGSLLGRYEIEIDQPSEASPPQARVLAVIRNAFGRGHSAEMTIYRHGGSAVFDAGARHVAARRRSSPPARPTSARARTGRPSPGSCPISGATSAGSRNGRASRRRRADPRGRRSRLVRQRPAVAAADRADHGSGAASHDGGAASRAEHGAAVSRRTRRRG